MRSVPPRVLARAQPVLDKARDPRHIFCARFLFAGCLSWKTRLYAWRGHDGSMKSRSFGLGPRCVSCDPSCGKRPQSAPDSLCVLSVCGGGWCCDRQAHPHRNKISTTARHVQARRRVIDARGQGRHKRARLVVRRFLLMARLAETTFSTQYGGVRRQSASNGHTKSATPQMISW